MRQDFLQTAVNKFQTDLFHAIQSAQFGEKKYNNGHKAKEALIRSQNLILNLHESTKQSLFQAIKKDLPHDWEVFPAIGKNHPEINLFGKLKAKDQDLVFLRHPRIPEKIITGPNAGEVDSVGALATSKAIAVGIRSQMSSIAKNFDTLMERAFAETLNMRLMHPTLVMGEVYLLPIFELLDTDMQKNQVVHSKNKINLSKFIKIFYHFTGRPNTKIEHQYKYDASALIFVDFCHIPPKVIYNASDLSIYCSDKQDLAFFEQINPEIFDQRIIESYKKIHP